MSKRTINWIILLMSIALVGLMTFQMYWINNAIKISGERFRQNVHEALRVVSDQLEQQEVLYTIVNKLVITDAGRTTYGRDTLRFISKNGVRNNPEKVWLQDEEIKRWYLDTDSMLLGGDSMAMTLDSRELLDPGLKGGWFNRDVQVEIKQFRAKIDSIIDGNDNGQLEIDRVQEKSQMVTVVLDELLSKNRKITNRVDPQQIDTLLASAFRDRGIDTPFEYGVLDNRQNSLIISKTDGREKELLESEFRTGLFTRDVIANRNMLAVFFPEQQSFLLGKIWITLTSSAFLLLTIMLCFAYALHIILKQKKISEIKNDFINNMTHEFKTPISTVSLACEALQDDDVNKNGAFLRKYVGIIKEENKRLGLQVEKVLQMATLERKDINLKMEYLNIHNIIDTAIRNIRIQVEKKEGTIITRLEATNTRVNADEVHLTNIIHNLLDNANKHSGDHPRITIETNNESDNLIIKISDEGKGMPKEVIKKIFDKFYRVPTGNLHDVKGFGLGLAYVKTMIEMMNGNIEARSTPGAGSIFEITLPQHD
jgi:two-component system phosphate regulon sensor histidine kinase PhoR